MEISRPFHQENDNAPGNDVYAIPVADAYLIYSPLRQIAALVNKEALFCIRDRSKNKFAKTAELEPLQDLFRELQKPIQEIPAERIGQIRPAFLGIIPTRACNLSCVYCNFGSQNTSDERMDFSMAVAAVEWMAKRVRKLGRKTLEIHFFGGEPFVAGEVVEVVIHRARALAAKLGLRPRFEVSTNGVFDKARARFVGDYFDTVVLSFDGPERIHDHHRPISKNRGSFKEVERTAHRLSESQADLCLRTCVTQQSVKQMEEIAQWFCTSFKPTAISFETLRPTPESTAAGLKPPDPYEFAIQYTRAARIIDSYGIQTVYASLSTDSPRLSFCPVGKDTVIVSPDGRLAGCYLPDSEWKARDLDFYLGRLSDNGEMHIDLGAVQRLRHLVTRKPRCKQCFCRWICAGGCHVNQTYPGCPERYNDFCVQTRIIMFVSILFRMGLDDLANSILEDRGALEALALRPSDLLEYCEV